VIVPDDAEVVRVSDLVAYLNEGNMVGDAAARWGLDSRVIHRALVDAGYHARWQRDNL
jgi:hypothetical protein